MKQEFLIITTTYPKLSDAKKLAKILLTKKLAACVQFTKIESNFKWQNKISCEKEILLSIKTKANFYNKIEQEILSNHPYKVPQIIAIKIERGFSGYFDWIESSLGAVS